MLNFDAKIAMLPHDDEMSIIRRNRINSIAPIHPTEQYHPFSNRPFRPPLVKSVFYRARSLQRFYDLTAEFNVIKPPQSKVPISPNVTNVDQKLLTFSVDFGLDLTSKPISQLQKAQHLETVLDFLDSLPNERVILAFCDGSAQETYNVGSGVYVTAKDPNEEIDLKISKAVSNGGTINFAECVAIYEALLIFEGFRRTNHFYYLFTDSSYVFSSLRGTQEITKYEYLFNDIKFLILNLREKGNIVCLNWIPGHINLEPHDIADQLAKQGAAKVFLYQCF